MPAQWPTFIAQVSNKMSSHSPLGPDDFGSFVANEYFKAVSTAQTPFGNIHAPGQKTILEVGFKKAFNELFNSTEPLLEDKKSLEPYSDMDEELPTTEPYNMGLEFENWIEENEDNINPFKFYEFFKKVSGDTNIKINKNILIDAFGDTNMSIKSPKIQITKNISIDVSADVNTVIRKITFKGIDGGGAPYTFKYSIDGEIQPELKTNSDSDSISIELPQFNQGERSLAKYKLISVIGKSGLEGLVNQAVDVILDDELLSDDDLFQRDTNTPIIGLNEFKIAGSGVEQNTTFHKIPDMGEEQIAAGIAQRVYYQYDGTEEFVDWVNRLNESSYPGLSTLSSKVKDIVNGLLYNNDKQNITTEIQTLYTPQFLEYGQADIDKINARYPYSPYYSTAQEQSRTDKKRKDAYEARKKEIDENNERVQALIDSEIIRIYDERAINLTAKVKEENHLNQKVFQNEYSDDQENLPDWITKNLIVTFVYIKSIDINPNPQKNENYRRQLKKAFYVGEVTRFNNLKKEWIQSLIDDSEKEALAADNAEQNLEEDPYVVMAACVLNYWKSTIAQPFNPAPPIPLCNIPSPGTYIPIYYGSKKKLADDLRRAWNTGKNFKQPPTLRAATSAVSSAVAVSFAKHLVELKFIYTGQLYVGTASIPMIGFVPTTF